MVVFELSPPGPGKTEWTRADIATLPPDALLVNDSPLAMDGEGNLYGVWFSTRGDQRTNVFKLTRPVAAGGAWGYQEIHAFTRIRPSNGYLPTGVVYQDGALFGLTQAGGDPDCNCGVAFKLRQPAPVNTRWIESVLFDFTYSAPEVGPVAPNTVPVFDWRGGMIGAARGNNCPALDGGCGYVFDLMRPGTIHAPWQGAMIQSFGTSGPHYPDGQLVRGAGDVVYGTTSEYTEHKSTSGLSVYEAQPPSTSGSGWSLRTIYHLPEQAGGYAAYVLSPMVYRRGSLFAVVDAQVSRFVLELSPASGGSWTARTVATFTSVYPYSGLVKTADGALYGTAITSGAGLVYQLLP